MPPIRLATLVRRLRRDPPVPGGSSDADLLARFARSQDDAAFELLVWRHGAMVLAACRRILGQTEDAEDAFQAVFLVLARKARSVARGAALPAWLHRVAVRLAIRLARSRRPVAPLQSEPYAAREADPIERAEAMGILDEEINALPERLRRAVVFCYLEGQTAEDAARQLGCPKGTVESRLAAARRTLRDRLTRRGVTLPALAVAGEGLLASDAVARTVRASAAFARGEVIASETSARLAKGVLIMWQTRKWAGVASLAAVLALGAGVGWAKWPNRPEQQPAVAAALPVAPAPQAKDKPPAPAEAWPLARRMAGGGTTLVSVAPDSSTLVIRHLNDVYGIGLARNVERVYLRSQNPVGDVALSPDGKYVATAEGIHGVKLRDATTGEVIEALWPSGKLPAQRVAFTADSKRLVTLGYRTDDPLSKKGGKGGGKWEPGGFKGTTIDELRNLKVTVHAQVSVWDMTTRKEVGYPVESTTVPRIAESGLSAPSYQLADNGRFVLKTENILPARKVNSKDPNDGPPSFGELMTRPGERTGLRFAVIDTATGTASQPVEIKDANLNIPRVGSLSPDGKTVVATDEKDPYKLRLMDTTSGKARVKLSSLLRPIQAFTFSPDGRYFAAASGRDRGGANAQIAAPSEVVIWDAATGKELARLADKESIRDYTELRFSPDGSFIVAQDNDGPFTIWGHPPKAESKPEPKPEPVAPSPAAKKPPATAPGVPDRFQALFQSLAAEGVTDQRRIEGVFLAALGRLPTDVESRTLATLFAKQSDKTAALRDLLNTLVDTAEFKAHAETLYRLAK